MKSVILFLLCITTGLYAQKYDAKLAGQLGADERGMKNYILAILKTGKYVPETKAERDSLFGGHFRNIEKLSNEGKLVVAGPFGKNKLQYRGLFILNVSTIEEANQLLLTDPTVKSGIFEVEVLSWYGSAALPVYLETHKRIEKKSE